MIEVSEVLERTYDKMFKSMDRTQSLIRMKYFMTAEEILAFAIKGAWEGQAEYRKAFKSETE